MTINHPSYRADNNDTACTPADAPVIALTSDEVEIQAGDYVVAGDAQDDLDWGKAFLDDDGHVMVLWEGSGAASIGRQAPDGTPPNVGRMDVYATRAHARARYHHLMSPMPEST